MPRTHEDLTQLALNLLDADRQVQWGLADYAREDTEANGTAARAIASDWGLSASTVNKLIRAARLFPNATQRNPELTMSHYILACATADPPAWITDAADHQWSTRDLRDAIRVAHAEDPTAEQARQAQAAVQRLLHVWDVAESGLRSQIRDRLRPWVEEHWR